MIGRSQGPRGFAGLAVLLAALLLHTTALTADPERTRAVAGVPASFPPHYALDERGEPSGFAIDVMNAIAAAADIDIEYRVFDDWRGTLDALRVGGVDLVPDLGVSAERAEYAGFTDPIEVFAIAFFVRDEGRIEAPEQLIGRRVGAVGANVAARLLAERGDTQLRQFDSPVDAVRELMAGRVDAVAYPSPVMWNILRELRIDHLVRELSPPLMEVKRAMAIGKVRPQLVERLGAATDAFVRSPLYDEIYARWFGRPRPFWSIERVIWIAAGLIAAAVLLLGTWRYLSVRRLLRDLETETEVRRRAEQDLRALTKGLEQRVAERTEALRQSELRHRLVLEHLSAGAVVHTPDTAVTYFNPRAESLLGLKHGEALGKTADDPRWRFVATDSRSLAVDDYPVNRVIAAGHPVDNLVMGVIRPDPQPDRPITWLLVRGVPIADENGRLGEAVITFVDITEQRRLAERSRQLERFDALGRLTAGVAHELNNPLMGIINGAQYCLSPESEDAMRTQVLRDIERHTKRCTGIVESLLTFSRSAATPKHPFVESNVETLIGHVLRLLEYRVRDEQIEIRLESAADLPRVHLQADPFQQLMINLLTNAMDAVETASDKAITIALGVDAERLAISVTDRGTGIAVADQARIFDPFFTTKPAGKGTGLGLSTALSIVQDHNGTLDCYSSPGQGSTITVKLPLQPNTPIRFGIE